MSRHNLKEYMEESPAVPGERVIASGEPRVVIHWEDKYALMDQYHRVRSLWYDQITPDMARKLLGVSDSLSYTDMCVWLTPSYKIDEFEYYGDASACIKLSRPSSQ